MNNLDLSVVIANRNGASLLAPCIGSLRGSGRITFEVIVVDDASEDESRDLIVQAYPTVSSIWLPRSVGFGTACNKGTAISSGRYILFLNNDTIVQGSALDDLVEFADGHPELKIGALGFVLKNELGKPTHSFGRFPGALGQFRIWASCFLGGTEDEIRTAAFSKRLSHFPVDYITGAALLIPRVILDEVGGFDERFFLYFEDCELQKRISNAGYGRYIVCGPSIIHIRGGGKERTNRIRILTYKSLLLYHRLTMRPRVFFYYRFFFFLISLFHLFNRTYSMKENREFVICCFHEAFSKENC
jgi:GT2 family glycosyltransferase